MRRRVTFVSAALVGVALVGCPDWSRPDPRLSRERSGAPAPAAASTGREPVAAPAPVPGDPAPDQPLAASGLEALREGVGALKVDAPDALERLERLESLGFDVLERGTPEAQREAEALLERLSDLRAELVEGRRAGGG